MQQPTCQKLNCSQMSCKFINLAELRITVGKHLIYRLFRLTSYFVKQVQDLTSCRSLTHRYSCAPPPVKNLDTTFPVFTSLTATGHLFKSTMLVRIIFRIRRGPRETVLPEYIDQPTDDPNLCDRTWHIIHLTSGHERITIGRPNRHQRTIFPEPRRNYFPESRQPLCRNKLSGQPSRYRATSNSGL